jgi:hypothetical protein
MSKTRLLSVPRDNTPRHIWLNAQHVCETLPKAASHMQAGWESSDPGQIPGAVTLWQQCKGFDAKTLLTSRIGGYSVMGLGICRRF